MIRFLIHYGLHFVAPAGIAYGFGYEKGKKLYLIFLASMLIDLDHLLANPVFDPKRCSIGFHPLHTLPAALIYSLMLFHPRLRWWGIAFLFHLLTDSADCFMMLNWP
ncbi:MAG: hypothetical protein K1X92_17395 [Bacteroidia bacterium]|nr:hypothetical protein [Bacteroidia bacterium]